MLAERMRTLTGDIVDHWLRRAPGRRTVVSAVNVAHSREIVARFQAAGIAAEHLDGNTPRDLREACLARLRSGETLVMSQCNILSEGFDLPALEAAILARPTASMCLHRQIVGRVMRAAPGKGGAIVLDHAGNFDRHGSVAEDVPFTLDGKVKKPVEAPNKTCPTCYAVLPLGARVCPQCGHSFAATETPEIETLPGELVEWSSVDFRSNYYTAMVAECTLANRRLGWARHAYFTRFAVWPNTARDRGGLGRKAAEIEQGYTCTMYEPKTTEWGERCARCCRVHHRSENTTARN